MEETQQKGVSPVIAAISIAVMLSLAGLAVKYASDSRNLAEDQVARQEDLIAKSNVDIIKKNAARKPDGEAGGRCAPFFGKPTGQREEIGLPVDCKISIGSGFGDWQLNVPAGQKSSEQFEFEVRDESGNVIQKIPVGGIDYSSQAVIANTSGDDINFANDINFDGYLDLRVLKFLAASNVIYDYWIFDPADKKFKQDPVLTDVPNADFDGGKRTINAYSASGPDPANWTVFKYEFVDGAYNKTIEE